MSDNLIDEIRRLESESLSLEPGTEQRNEMESVVMNYVDRFLEGVRDMPGYNGDTSVLKAFEDHTFSEEPVEIEAAVSFIREHVDPVGIHPASGGHLGYIPGGGIYPSALGDLMADVVNKYAGVWFGGPGAVKLENDLIRWICDLMGYPEHALGNLTSGGSIANLIAIVTARDAKNVVPENIRKSVIYLTDQVHHSIQKAIRIAGLEYAIIRYINRDNRFRMDADHLRTQVESDRSNGLKPFLIVGSIGTTDTGAVDPIGAIASIAKEHDIWFHIDAAYGGFFILSRHGRDKFSDVDQSDSLTIDPHKGMFLPYGSGAVIIKDVEQLRKSHVYDAAYMRDAQAAEVEASPANLSPELTKHFRGLRMWLPMKVFGLAPFRAALDEKILLCRYFHKRIAELGFEVGPAPELSVCIYRYIPKHGNSNEFNKALVEEIHRDGRVFLSSTTIDGHVWLRLAVLCFRTHLATIDLAINMLEKSLNEVKSKWQQG